MSSKETQKMRDSLLDVDEAEKAFKLGKAIANPILETLNKIFLKTIHSDVKVDVSDSKYVVFSTAESEGDPIVYVHGSGYFFLSPMCYASMLAQICKTAKRKVYAITYPLLPDANAVEIEEIISRRINTLPFPARIIGGDSAGGGSIVRCLSRGEFRLDKPPILFLFSPWIDLSSKSYSVYTYNDPFIFKGVLQNVHNYMQETETPDYNPIIRGHFDKLFLSVADKESLTSDAYNLWESLTDKGEGSVFIVHENSFHVHPIGYPIIQKSKETIDSLANFLSA